MEVAISEKRCGCYVHMSENNKLQRVSRGIFYSKVKSQTSKVKCQTSKVMWAPMDKLVPQLPKVVTFAYDLRFRHVIACWKGIFKK